MTETDSLKDQIVSLLDCALKEDLGSYGDLTSKFIFAEGILGEARIVAKNNGVFCGNDIARQIFLKMDPKLVLEDHVLDGEHLHSGECIFTVRGSVRSILAAERTVLNFIQRLSGIATLTTSFVEMTTGTKAKILDTRKTIPGWRFLDKYAVRCGGGLNHRFGLHDMILIKENHIAAAGGIIRAVQKVREGLKQSRVDLPVEVETQNLTEVKEALAINVDRIMLDNMSLEQIRKAVKLVGGHVPVEASGGVSLETVAEIAATGVDYISVGALTHSAVALDMSLLMT